MTELVTSFAAESQLNLLASRQQGFGVSGTNSDSTSPAPTSDANALKSVLLASDKAQDQSFAPDTAEREANSGVSSGPSRPRVEIKQFDVGLSPSEVVGTPDVLQRFDANRDGRLDMMEGSRAALVRQNVFTFAGLAAAPSPSAPSAIVAEQQQPPPPPINEADAPTLARETGAAIAALGTFDAQGLPKKFAAAEAEAAGAKKYYDGAAAVAGAPSGTTDAPKKYYGQGVEVVAGQAVNNGSLAPTKYADRVPVREQTVSEEGTGEVKYYDRVPQTEAGGGGEDEPNNSQKYHDKALEVLEAYVHAAEDETLENVRIATVVTA